MAEGFKKCGQHKESTEDDPLSVSYDIVMSQAMCELGPEEKAACETGRAQVIQQFKDRGSVTNEFLDSLNIPKIEESINRDELTLCRQDAQLITHADSVERYKLMQQKKQTRTDPALLKLEKKKKEAAKFVKKYAKVENKRQEDLHRRQQNEQLKVAEKLRKQTLTPAQKKQEAAQNKISNKQKQQEIQQKKAEKEAARQREYEHAQDLLGEAAAVFAIRQSALSNQPSNVAVPSQTEEQATITHEEESSDEDLSEEEEDNTDD